MMDHTNRTKEQLLRELETQRQRIAELESRCHKTEERLQQIHRKYDQLVDNSTDIVHGIARDTTLEETQKTQLQESEQRFRDIFAKTADGMLVADVETGSFYMANQAICQMLGYSNAEIIQRSVRDIHPEKDLPAVLKEFDQQAHGRKNMARELPVKRKDGSVFHADINTVPITLDGRSFVLGIFRDVTALLQAHQALEESEKKYRVLVESASEAITVFDAHGTIKFANARVREHFGADSDELVGKTMWDLFPEPVAGRQMGYVQQVIETGAGMTTEVPSEIQGQEKWFEATLVPIRSVGGKVLDVMVIARDVTELKNARDELSTFHRQMMQTERLASTGTLSAMVAHELNQPLTVIKLSVQNVLSALNANQPPETCFEDLNECLKGVENAAERVSRFRSFARGAIKGRKELVVLGPLIDKTLPLIEEGCRQARLAIAVEGFEGLSLHACPQDLEQLFFILIENSIQASDRKTDHHLTITGSSRENCIEVRLADDCGGIAPENLDEIFRLFFTTKPRNEGTGLGLCIAERIVTEMEGKITVNNHSGQGVTFCVSLPIQPDI